MSGNAANWLHLERLRPVDDGRIVQNAEGEAEFETFRLKAILRFGNVVPLADLAAFDLSAVPEEEWDELLNIAVVHGFDPATLERALKRGHF